MSMYLSSDPSNSYLSLSSLSLQPEEADRYATLLAEDVKRSPLDAQSTLDSVWKELTGSGKACAAHRARYPFLADCDICMMDFAVHEGRPDAIAQVAAAVRSLEGSASFAEAMPEVSVNLAFAPEGASSVANVVAVPGRIVRVRGRAASAMRPEYGASGHLARVLLLAQKKRKKTHACLNLRYDRRMGRALKKLGLRPLVVGGYPQSSGDPTVAALTAKLVEGAGTFDVLVDSGGNGVEPNVYLFAETPAAVAALALRLSKIYSAG